MHHSEVFSPHSCLCICYSLCLDSLSLFPPWDPRTQGRHQLPRDHPRVFYLSLPLCLLLSKHFSIQVQLLIYLFSPRRLRAQWGKTWGCFLSGFHVLCMEPGLSTSVDWMNKQQKGIDQVPSWTQKKITVCIGHRVNARAMPLTRKAYPADLCSSYLVWSIKRVTPRNYYIP